RTKQAEQSRREAEARAEESSRALEQIRLRIRIARHDVHDANIRAETAATAAFTQVQEAQTQAQEAQTQAQEALVRCDRALRERDALLSSTVWQMTYLLRTMGNRMPPQVRGVLRRGAKFAWWFLTVKLRRKLRERHAALATSTPVSIPESE